MALSAIGEGCHQQMEAILNEIVSFVLLFCSDPVRHTPLNLVVVCGGLYEEYSIFLFSNVCPLKLCSRPVANVTGLVYTAGIMLYGGFEFNFLFLPQHPRVRYAACNAIGQMATDFAPTFQKKFHDKVTAMKTALFSNGYMFCLMFFILLDFRNIFNTGI